jgi:hypothetical protein
MGIMGASGEVDGGEGKVKLVGESGCGGGPAGDERWVCYVSKRWQALSSELPRKSQSPYGVRVGS